VTPSAQKSERRATSGARRGPPSQRHWLPYGVLAVLIAGGVALVVTTPGSDHSTKTRATGPPGTQSFSGLSRNHTNAPVSYPQTPPVGGDHAPIWQDCGFYREPIPNERGVHSMEHGAVWITYRPNLVAAEVKRVRDLAQGYVLVSAFENLPSPIVASAWGRQLRLDSVQDPRLDAFIQDFRQGPQTPEPGARCTGGAGTPD